MGILRAALAPRTLFGRLDHRVNRQAALTSLSTSETRGSRALVSVANAGVPPPTPVLTCADVQAPGRRSQTPQGMSTECQRAPGRLLTRGMTVPQQPLHAGCGTSSCRWSCSRYERLEAGRLRSDEDAALPGAAGSASSPAPFGTALQPGVRGAGSGSGSRCRPEPTCRSRRGSSPLARPIGRLAVVVS